MSKVALRIAFLLVALVGLGLVVWSAGAVGGGPGILHKLHGGGGDHCNPMDHAHQLIEDMNLDAGQQQHVEAIHSTLMDVHSHLPEHHLRLLVGALERLESGYTDPFEVRQHIDTHLEALRHTAYTLADEWVALGNSLDSSQREVVREHLEAALVMVEKGNEQGSWLSQLGKRLHGHSNQGHSGHGGSAHPH